MRLDSVRKKGVEKLPLLFFERTKSQPTNRFPSLFLFEVRIPVGAHIPGLINKLLNHRETFGTFSRSRDTLASVRRIWLDEGLLLLEVITLYHVHRDAYNNYCH